MNRDDCINALELELHGLDQELKNKKLLHRSLSIAIDYLEAQQKDLQRKLERIKK